MPSDPTGARLHHIGYVTGDLGGTVERLRRAFGFNLDSVPITDPIQTATVQFLRLPGDAAWLEVVAPAGQPSKLDGALKRGVRLHHLCFEVSAVAEWCRRLQDHGFVLVAPPASAVAFSGRNIAWFADRAGFLVELVEAGAGDLCLEAAP